MQTSSEQVQAALARLADPRARMAFLVDVYLTSSIYRGEARFNYQPSKCIARNLIFWWAECASELLAQYTELSQESQYDAVLDTYRWFWAMN
jgi:hypothetical protein